MNIYNLLNVSESEGPMPLHIVVFCKARIFTMMAVDSDEEPLTPPELQLQFQRIQDMCSQQSEGPGLGALTAHDRPTWAKVGTNAL